MNVKIGVSSYSLSRAIRSGQLDWPGAIQWTAENGGEHFEVVALEIGFGNDRCRLGAIAKASARCNIPISSYTIGANFLTESVEAYEAEVQRVCREVDVAAALGVSLMRHDAGIRLIPETGTARFEHDFPRLVEACQRVADYAKPFGITTSVENHGFHLQASERVHRLVLAVDRENFRTTLDIGNFLCADEDPVASAKNNIGIASLIHFKDFYRRPPQANVGEGWFFSRAGFRLKGAVIGDGDIDIPGVVQVVREAGYAGFISVEFEGSEDCLSGTLQGMNNLRRLFQSQ